MTGPEVAQEQTTGSGLLGRLARDRSGNTIALLAAAVLPLIGLVGSGVDMGRSYLASSRLQQACDAGVLAARKRLGSSSPVSGTIPSDVATIGQRFFNINFRDGTYGTEGRSFQMTLEGDYSIGGEASVTVPTSLMSVFGFDEVPIKVECKSQLNFSALDVMMVLDVTGSMRHTNSGDTMSRIESLKSTIRGFHGELEASKAPGAEIRYGFVPYATNVNVGHLLQDDWVASSWVYQSREDTGAKVPNEEPSYTYYRNWTEVSGTRTEWTTQSTYAATYHAPANADETGYYTCDNALPADSWVTSQTFDETATTSEIQTDPPAVLKITPGEKLHNGTRYKQVLNGDQCEVQASTDTNYLQSFEKVDVVPSLENTVWRYKPLTLDVTNWRTETEGCIEERATYNITDFTNVDLTQALDLDIDLVPTAGDPDTQWKPRYPEEIYVRKILQDGTGSVSKPQMTTADNYADTGNWWFSDCTSSKAQKLTPMTLDELNTYLDTLTPYGATYHDIGMIWGARLISPTGLFATENAPNGSDQKTRHLIFLTDGQTEPYDLAYGAYGVEPLDERRWTYANTLTLSETVEQRFKFACEEVKKRNVTVWIIAFGTYANQAMIDCAGNGRYFEAANAEELNDAFASIARSMADLRISG